jgi:hypothetical protein
VKEGRVAWRDHDIPQAIEPRVVLPFVDDEGYPFPRFPELERTPEQLREEGALVTYLESVPGRSMDGMAESCRLVSALRAE